MNWFNTFLYLFAIISHVPAQNIASQETHDSNSHSEITPKNGRRQYITAHKVSTKTLTTRINNGNSGSGLQGWVTETQNNVLQPQIQSIIQSQQPCSPQTNVLSTTGGRTSIVNKKSIVDSAQNIRANSIINPLNSLLPREDQYLSGQKRAGEEILIVDQLGNQIPNLPGSQASAQAMINNVQDTTKTIVTGEGIHSVQRGIDIMENGDNVFYPNPISQRISILPSGDAIYSNDLIGQQTQNQNVMVQPDENLENIVAVPVIRPQLGELVVHGYRPNIHYYLRQIDANNILNNPSVISKLPPFVHHLKPHEANVNLSEDQLNLYKQYLTQTGLIKLKPFQLIFSEQFKPNLKTMQWMAVPLDANEEYCRQQCSNHFAGKNIYRTIKDNSNTNIPLQLLVPIMKINHETETTVTRTQTVDKTGKIPVPGVWRTGNSGKPLSSSSSADN